MGGRGCARWSRVGGVKWDNCNSIINKYILKKKKKNIKNMNSKMTTNTQLLITESKNKNKLSKQLEQEQNHRNGDHMEGFQQKSGRKRAGEKVQRVSSINGR